jgi:hypothetical protein
VKRPNNGIALGLTPVPRLILCFVLVFTVSCGPPGESASGVRAATDAIQQQIAKYTAALDAVNINLASQVWLMSPELLGSLRSDGVRVHLGIPFGFPSGISIQLRWNPQ